jgi:uncharacterized protein YkwD
MAADQRGVFMRPLVVAVLAVATLVAPAAARADASAARCAGADALPGQSSANALRDATLCLMNAERTARGLVALKAQPTLAGVATRYAREMVREGFFDHTSPSGSTMLGRIRATSYLRDAASWSVGENLAWGTGALGTPRATVKAWMQSPPHGANLLDPRFRDVGIGIASGAPDQDVGQPGGTYVADFGRRVQR